MKKIFHLMSLLLGFAVSGMMLSACGDDDGVGPGSESGTEQEVDEKNAVALDANNSDGTLTYEIIGKTSQVARVKSCRGDAKSVKVPSAVKKGSKAYAVTEIGIAAFMDCLELTEVSIPESIVSIRAWGHSGDVVT